MPTPTTREMPHTLPSIIPVLEGSGVARTKRSAAATAATAAETVERLRNWASGRCLDADRPGLYARGSAATEEPGRGVRRGDPSSN